LLATNNTSYYFVLSTKKETEFAFLKETEVLKQAIDNFNLNTDGILAYMTNQLYASTRSLSVTVGEPAKMSRKDLLITDEL